MQTPQRCPKLLGNHRSRDRVGAMRGFWILPLLLLIAPAVALAQSMPGAAEYRTFTSTSGKTVRARLMKVERDDVILRFSNGADTAIAINALSVDDQAYIQKWNPRERMDAATKIAANQSGLATFLGTRGYTAAGLTQKGNAVNVDVKVNGEPFPFLFDIGRVLSLLDRRISDRMGATKDVLYAEYPTADGSIEKVVSGELKTFEVGGREIPDFTVGVANLERIGLDDTKGVFGGDILQYFDGIVDWGSMNIYLSKGS